MTTEEKLKRVQEAICEYMNAHGPHLYPSWKAFLIEKCDLAIDTGNQYQPVRPR